MLFGKLIKMYIVKYHSNRDIYFLKVLMILQYSMDADIFCK